MKSYKILAIDTSCDETSVAVLRGTKVLANLLPSQIELHEEYGGVVPSIAKLAHQERIDVVVAKTLKRAQSNIKEIDVIAVTNGPGLAIALEVGIKKAKQLATEFRKPLVAVNHMEGHLLSSFAERNSEKEIQIPKFPALGVLVSGGHTELILVEQFGKYKKIGETLDDSCGECFDKCGRILGLGYPAGPAISKFAKEHRKEMKIEIIKKDKSTLVRAFNKKTKKEYFLPIAMLNSGDFNFSYSGLKTAFRDLVSKIGDSNLNAEVIKDLCVTLESAALNQIILKVERAIKKYSPEEIWLGGGVVASARFRTLIRNTAHKVNKSVIVRYPYSNKLTGDNAAMIGVAAYLKIKELNLRTNVDEEMKKLENQGIFLSPRNFEKIDREPNLSL